MPQYLITGYLPDNYDPSAETEETIEGIHALNREMIAAGVRKFACGLGKAHTLRAQPNGEVILTDGPYLETKEHVCAAPAISGTRLSDGLRSNGSRSRGCGATASKRMPIVSP